MAEGSPRERLMARTTVAPHGCWLWTGVKTRHGYGYLRLDGRRSAVHRLSYLVHVGPIPRGMCVCHSCDMPACVRPDHLFLGTQADNLRDMARKGRRARGEKLPQSKLTSDYVRAIRNASGTHAEIAIRFGVSRPTISRAIAKKTWTQET